MNSFGLSILLPSYNNKCLELVKVLQRQCNEISDLKYEVIVVDDGSNDENIIACNKAISDIDNCKYIQRDENTGRAVVRNFLVSQASYQYVLFIDSDMMVETGDFIQKYIDSISTSDNDIVINGGVAIGKDVKPMRSNLRYLYEKNALSQHTSKKRQENEYMDFHTANFLTSKDIMIKYPFNEDFKKYGFEDVLLGKTLKKGGIHIIHIDNPVVFTEDFESNGNFIEKTETSLQTLHEFSYELKGYSRIDSFVDKLKKAHLLAITKIAGIIALPIIKKNLTSDKPVRSLFNIYKVLYYASLK